MPGTPFSVNSAEFSACVGFCIDAHNPTYPLPFLALETPQNAYYALSPAYPGLARSAHSHNYMFVDVHV